MCHVACSALQSVWCVCVCVCVLSEAVHAGSDINEDISSLTVKTSTAWQRSHAQVSLCML